MTIEEVRQAYEDEVGAALFRVEGLFSGMKRGKHLLVYPYKDGRRGYLWAQFDWDKNHDKIVETISAGGRERSFRDAVAIAVNCLVDQIEPPR